MRVFLPAFEEQTAAIQGAVGESSPATPTATVLVVEDEDAVREVARRILAGHGYTVLVASDPSLALRTCEAHDGTIDLILTDVVMPGFSGPELVERARAVRPGLRALYMSGYPEDFLARRHSVHENVEIIGKPFTAESLLRTVRLVLEPPEHRMPPQGSKR